MVVDITQFDQHKFYLLEHRIANSKPNYDYCVNSEQRKGPRYNDNRYIARIIMGLLYVEANFDYIAANTAFLALDSKSIEPYIEMAILKVVKFDDMDQTSIT